MLTQSTYTFYLLEKYTTGQKNYPNMELDPYFVFSYLLLPKYKN